MAAKPRQSKRTLQLPEVLDLNAAAPVAAQFLSHRGNDLLVDASQVRRIGGQGFQVLLSARKTWQHEGLTMRVTKPSAAFREGIELLGIFAGALLDEERTE
jgi:chemotaxis protein CheX